MNFLRRLFCGHYISMEVCKIHYHASSTELVYTKICKKCGKNLGVTKVKNIDNNRSE
ncbi:hypothetical protein [Yersinia phage fHe-Yen9-04]|nr:hypothetical protein FDJ41_gp438 [Yersinia phage fHe-Yen9-04]SOK58742.1 hypothetical protein [Yersinia phage fHe-Yen9-04]VUE36511.1 hypothetical protein [Yersinia phage fHe-Yen9-04]